MIVCVHSAALDKYIETSVRMAISKLSESAADSMNKYANSSAEGPTLGGCSMRCIYHWGTLGSFDQSRLVGARYMFQLDRSGIRYS